MPLTRDLRNRSLKRNNSLKYVPISFSKLLCINLTSAPSHDLSWESLDRIQICMSPCLAMPVLDKYWLTEWLSASNKRRKINKGMEGGLDSIPWCSLLCLHNSYKTWLSSAKAPCRAGQLYPPPPQVRVLLGSCLSFFSCRSDKIPCQMQLERFLAYSLRLRFIKQQKCHSNRWKQWVPSQS